ncbi:MAG: hypothetical protein E7240_01720 [Lachnospiraceae bacterium]|nr:hypothetical protein [Lachnospiraceae bacterium]
MTYFDMSEAVNKNREIIRSNDPAALEAVIDPDCVKGPEQVAALLTYLPEEQRMAAVKGFVAGMLLD